jgi:hypothetical protein
MAFQSSAARPQGREPEVVQGEKKWSRMPRMMRIFAICMIGRRLMGLVSPM